MNSAEETATEWLYHTMRVHMRAQRDNIQPSRPKDWINLCWDVGNSLTMMHIHGIAITPVIENVSAKLRLEFLGAKGLMPSDIQKMRVFYLNYFERKNLLPKIQLVNWECHIFILDHCRDPLQQEYYLDFCAQENCDLAGLESAFKAQRFELNALPDFISQ